MKTLDKDKNKNYSSNKFNRNNYIRSSIVALEKNEFSFIFLVFFVYTLLPSVMFSELPIPTILAVGATKIEEHY